MVVVKLLKYLPTTVLFLAVCSAQVFPPVSGGGGGSGTVTSVGTTGPLSGGPITSSGSISCPTCGVTNAPLSQFSSTTSSALATVISDETGSGLLVFNTSPTFVTPNLGTPSAINLTNATNVPLVINSTTISGGGTNAILYGDGTNLQNALGITRTGVGQITHTITALGTTTSDAVILTNTTAAAAGAQQVSPAIDLCGQGWKTTATAASQSVCFQSYALPVQGTTAPTAQLNLGYSVNGGAFTNLYIFSSTGVLSPATDNSQTLGASSLRFSSVFALTVDPGANTLTIGNAGANVLFKTNSTEAGRFVTSQNFLLGGITDGNYRLDVQKSGSSGTFRCFDQTVTVGTTKCLFQDGAGQSGAALQVAVNGGTVGFSATGAGLATANLYATGTNCANTASPAVCGSSAAGRVTIAASSTTVVVNTTAVTANSEIEVQQDDSLGAALSVTCYTASNTAPRVTARTAGTSFTITASAPVTNPGCYTYKILN